jgi:hypothetical protein
MLTTPQGKLSRYFYGIDYPARDLRLGLIESSQTRLDRRSINCCSIAITTIRPPVSMAQQ